MTRFTSNALSTLDTLARTLDEELKELSDRALLRVLSTIEEVRDSSVRIEGRWLVSWCSNDYLGLSIHPQVIQAACEAAVRWGVGSRASRLLAGSTRLHAELEEGLASFFNAEAAAVFSSGYLANLGTLQALLTREDLVLVDRFAHASLIDACRATRATFRVFHHNDASHVAKLLGRSSGARRRLVVTEGLFSMDGDFAPLDQLLEAVQAHDAFLYIDDAHGAFAVGATGRGSPELAGVPHEAMIYMGTLGKALGCQGGFVVGPQPLIDVLHNRARTFIYSTALAGTVVAAALEALRFVREDPTPRTRLARNVQDLHNKFRFAKFIRTEIPQIKDHALGRGLLPSHIIPIMVGSSRRACELSSMLLSRGMFAPAIRPPTVPEGTARIRVSVTARHTEAQIRLLVQALAEALAETSPQSTPARRWQAPGRAVHSP